MRAWAPRANTKATAASTYSNQQGAERGGANLSVRTHQASARDEGTPPARRPEPRQTDHDGDQRPREREPGIHRPRDGLVDPAAVEKPRRPDPTLSESATLRKAVRAARCEPKATRQSSGRTRRGDGWRRTRGAPHGDDLVWRIGAEERDRDADEDDCGEEARADAQRGQRENEARDPAWWLRASQSASLQPWVREQLSRSTARLAPRRREC